MCFISYITTVTTASFKEWTTTDSTDSTGGKEPPLSAAASVVPFPRQRSSDFLHLQSSSGNGRSNSETWLTRGKCCMRVHTEFIKPPTHDTLLDAGPFPESALLKKITTLSQFQCPQRLWHRSLVGQPLLLPEAKPSQSPWHWGSIKLSHFHQQRDLARPVKFPNLREKEIFFFLSLVRKDVFSPRNFV